MAKEKENKEANLEEPVGISNSSKKSLNPKVFMIGLPLFILQLVIVYFVTANILLTKYESAPQKTSEGETIETADADTGETEDEAIEADIGKYVYSIEDIIVNPTGTNGQRLLLISLGFDLRSEENLKVLEEKQFIVKDIVISTLSAKSLGELSAIGQKDSLKVELSSNLMTKLPSVKINSVYFSKYVIN